MTAPTPTQAVSIRMPTHVVERIDEYGAKTGLSRTATILIAIQRGLRFLPGVMPEVDAAPEYRDWISGMTYSEIAEKHGLPDRQSAARAVRAAQQSLISDLHDSGRIVIHVDPERLPE